MARSPAFESHGLTRHALCMNTRVPSGRACTLQGAGARAAGGVASRGSIELIAGAHERHTHASATHAHAHTHSTRRRYGVRTPDARGPTSTRNVSAAAGMADLFALPHQPALGGADSDVRGALRARDLRQHGTGGRCRRGDWTGCGGVERPRKPPLPVRALRTFPYPALFFVQH